MSQEAMSTQEYIEYLERDIAKGEWQKGALEFTKSLLAREKELEKATRERDKALAERDKAIADFEARKKRDAAAADRERVALAAELTRERELSNSAVAKDMAEVAKLQEQLDRLRVLKTEAEERHEQKMAAYAASEDDARARVDGLLKQETEIRGRLTAALGR